MDVELSFTFIRVGFVGDVSDGGSESMLSRCHGGGGGGGGSVSLSCFFVPAVCGRRPRALVSYDSLSAASALRSDPTVIVPSGSLCTC